MRSSVDFKSRLKIQSQKTANDVCTWDVRRAFGREKHEDLTYPRKKSWTERKRKKIRKKYHVGIVVIMWSDNFFLILPLRQWDETHGENWIIATPAVLSSSNNFTLGPLKRLIRNELLKLIMLTKFEFEHIYVVFEDSEFINERLHYRWISELSHCRRISHVEALFSPSMLSVS